jgi:putative transcriptional regulator
MKPAANNLQSIRNEKGLTQEELAEAVGVSRQTIISIEKGKYIPSVALALKIAGYFSLKVEDIFK